VSQHESPPSKSPTIQPARSLKAGDIELEPSRWIVSIRGKAVQLTSKEFGLLQVLIEARGAVVAREHLLEKVWGYEAPPEPESHTVNVHIHRLRRKLGSEGRRVLTVRNVGYRFDISSNWIKFGT
jgi:two-component system alkaline phosphatase synthesis response regulator PhoP